MDSRMRVTSLTRFRVAQERLATTENRCGRPREKAASWAIAIFCLPLGLGSNVLNLRLRSYWLNRKNIWVPIMGLVTTFCPMMPTGGVELVFQTVGETRLVAHSKVN